MYDPKYRESYRAAAAAKRLRMREWLKSLKDKPCADCGGVFPPECMDFDHRDRKTKRMSVGLMISQRSSKDAILEEVAKCDLVCANCHRIRTFAAPR